MVVIRAAVGVGRKTLSQQGRVESLYITTKNALEQNSS